MSKGNPRALDKFRDDDDRQRNAGANRASPIDEHRHVRAPTAFAQPVADHACLRQRECAECADGKQRNEFFGYSSKADQDQPGNHRERGDPLGENETPSPIGE